MKQISHLSSKHVVITGGSSGIGRELIRHLYSDNTISVIGRKSPRLDAIQTEFPNIIIYEADLSNLDEIKHAGDALAKSGKPIDLLINNAAVQYTPHFLDDDFRIETIEEEINTNLVTPAILTFKTLPALLASDAGTILNINSGLGLVPKTSSSVYCAAKGGLNILSQSLSNQLEDKGIRVVQAFLPLVDTGMTSGRGSKKLSASHAARAILKGLEKGGSTIDVGKVKLLRWVMRLSPALASRIMKRA